MNSLNHLGKVVKRMKKHELEALNTYLTSFKIDRIYKESKSAILVELLADNKQPNVPEVLQFKLYGKTNPIAFRKLVDRTKDKVYESLLFDNNLEKANVHPVRHKVGYVLKKKIIEAEILSTRGLNEEVEVLYEKMLNKAIEYEFYDLVLDILYKQHTFSAFRYGENKLKKIRVLIDKYELFRNEVNKARLIFENIGVKTNFSANPEDYLSELPDLITTLEKSYSLTKSPIIGFFKFFVETEYFQQKGRYIEARNALLQIVNLLVSNVSVRTRRQLGLAYGNLANNELLTHEFNRGIEYVNKACDYYKESPVNLNVVKEVEFFLWMFQDQFEKSESIIVELHQSSARQKASFLFYKRTYLYACLKNIQGDFKRSEELLNEVKEIEKDKEGWNIGIRLLQIMNLIDRGKHDLIESNVQNLKKYLGRLKGQRQARKRYAVILRILTRLMNDNYYFRKTFRRSGKYFDLLLSKDERYAWSVKGPEVVAFHEWFVSRMEMRKFSYARIFGSDGDAVTK